jgi:ubiquinone biosynthesis protein COQ4
VRGFVSEAEAEVNPESVIVNPRRLGLLGFVREAARARRVGPVPETVFRLFRPFHGPQLDNLYQQAMADETGSRILREGRSLHPALLDFDRLRALPSGTLGNEYVRFMEGNGIDIVSFAEASLRHMAREDYANDEAWTLVNRGRDTHELIHVVSGYGTDELGEMCELAFNIQEDPRPRATRLAIRINVAGFRRRGYRHAEAVIAEAFRRGARTGLLVVAHWEAMLDWQLEDVRDRLSVSEPPSYEPIPPSGKAPPAYPISSAVRRA